MTTNVPYDPISSACSTDWIPLEGLTERWAAFAASSMTPRTTAAVASAFRALSHERLALRQVTHAAHARRTFPAVVPARPVTWFDEAVSEREYVLSCLQEAAQGWEQAAGDLAGHLRDVPCEQSDERRSCAVLFEDALTQRLRLARLLVEVLDEQAACLRAPSHTTPLDAPFDGEVQP